MAYAPVELLDSVAPHAHRVLSPETVVREAGYMHVVRGEIHEERLLFILLDKIDGVCHDRIGDILVFPKRLAATFHVTDTADSVYDGLVVPETRLLVV